MRKREDVYLQRWALPPPQGHPQQPSLARGGSPGSSSPRPAWLSLQNRVASSRASGVWGVTVLFPMDPP